MPLSRQGSQEPCATPPHSQVALRGIEKPMALTFEGVTPAVSMDFFSTYAMIVK